jgi:hypothetical protein
MPLLWTTLSPKASNIRNSNTTNTNFQQSLHLKKKKIVEIRTNCNQLSCLAKSLKKFNCGAQEKRVDMTQNAAAIMNSEIRMVK